MRIRFKKLDPRAEAPAKAHGDDACADLVGIAHQRLEDGEGPPCFEYRTGLALEIPPGHAGLLFPRSSVSRTSGWMANSVGVIDAGYRGEIKLRFRAENAPYRDGQRIAQLMIVALPAPAFEESEELSDTRRGDGGFGSTGT